VNQNRKYRGENRSYGEGRPEKKEEKRWADGEKPETPKSRNHLVQLYKKEEPNTQKNGTASRKNFQSPTVSSLGWEERTRQQRELKKNNYDYERRRDGGVCLASDQRALP